MLAIIASSPEEVKAEILRYLEWHISRIRKDCDAITKTATKIRTANIALLEGIREDISSALILPNESK